MGEAATSDARLARLEDRFATFMQDHAEFRGALKADMDESKRQRSGLFTMVKQVSDQLVEFTTKFDSHADNEEVMRLEFISRIERVESRQDALGDRTASPCAPAAPAPPPSPTPSAATEPPAGQKPWWVAMATGGGLLTFLFGENVAEGIANAAKAIRSIFH